MIRRTAPQPHPSRAGMSLTEVLVALFILTLGVIGILTMFPLGAAQMAMAVRDDRSALAALNADNVMRWYWQTYVVPQPQNYTVTPGQTQTIASNSTTLSTMQDPSFQPKTGLFDSNPLVPNNGLFQGNGIQAQTWGEMSYPVVVDPMGVAAGWKSLGDGGGTFIPRCTLSAFAGIQSATPAQLTVNNLIPQNHLSNFPFRLCSLTDTMGFNDNGTPTPDLEMRYNWMWVLQRPQFVDLSNTSYNPNNLYTVNMTVVVYDRRAFGYPTPAVTGYETVLSAGFTTGSTTVTITQNQSDQALDLKPGTWVMDATITPVANNGALPIRQANFYRVVSLTPNPANLNQTLVELQTPIAAPTGYPPMGYPYTGTLVALRGVSGVFVRPPLTYRWN